MTNFIATKAVTIYKTVEEAAAALETALEVVNNTALVKTCTIIRIEGNKYAAILVYTDAP